MGVSVMVLVINFVKRNIQTKTSHTMWSYFSSSQRNIWACIVQRNIWAWLSHLLCLCYYLFFFNQIVSQLNFWRSKEQPQFLHQKKKKNSHNLYPNTKGYIKLGRERPRQFHLIHSNLAKSNWMYGIWEFGVHESWPTNPTL